MKQILPYFFQLQTFLSLNNYQVTMQVGNLLLKEVLN